MTVKKLEKNKSIDDFISGGGKTTEESKALDDTVKITLRIPKEYIEKLDKHRKGLPGKVSRNTAIINAIHDYLA